MSNVAADRGDRTDNEEDLSWMDYGTSIWANLYWDAITGRELPRQALRTGWGATTSHTYARTHARAIFAYTLYRIVPELSARLISDEALQLHERTMKNLTRKARFLTDCITEAKVHGEGTVARMLASPEFAEIEREEENTRRVVESIVQSWQSDYCLYDDWLAVAAENTIAVAAIFNEFGHEYGGMLAAYTRDASPYDGLLSDPEPDAPLPERVKVNVGSTEVALRPARNERVAYGISWEQLAGPQHNTCAVDEHNQSDRFGHFDPRFETEDEAVSRILPDLEARLRRVLRETAAADIEDKDAIEPSTFRKTTAFEWLVRYQVLGESRRQISYGLAEEKWAHEPDWERRHNAYDNTGHVGKEIRKVADLIGLTLRNP